MLLRVPGLIVLEPEVLPVARGILVRLPSVVSLCPGI